MTKYFVMRILIIIPTLFAVLFITFLIGYLGPMDPVTMMQTEAMSYGVLLTPEEVADLRHKYGLDRPFFVQFGTYVNNLLHGNFGYSYLNAAPVGKHVMEALPVSGSLAMGAMVILVVLGIPLGALAAKFHNTWVDYTIVSTSLFLSAFPTYVLVPMTLIVLVLWLRVMNVPVGWEGVLHPQFFVAAALISLRTLVVVIRQTRTATLEVLASEYVRTARAKGLTELQILIRHIMRNALIPVVTSIGMLIDDFMWGAVFIDLAFNLPGLGRLFTIGLEDRDFNMIYAVTIFTAFVTILFNLLVDLIYPLLDPRVVYD